VSSPGYPQPRRPSSSQGNHVIVHTCVFRVAEFPSMGSRRRLRRRAYPPVERSSPGRVTGTTTLRAALRAVLGRGPVTRPASPQMRRATADAVDPKIGAPGAGGAADEFQPGTGRPPGGSWTNERITRSIPPMQPTSVVSRGLRPLIQLARRMELSGSACFKDYASRPGVVPRSSVSRRLRSTKSGLRC